MKIVYFTKIGEGVPHDLIPLRRVSEITGYHPASLYFSNNNKTRIKHYCTIYKRSPKLKPNIYYSEAEVWEYLNKYNIVSPLSLNKENYYTYNEISKLYNMPRCTVTTIYFALKKINDQCPLDKYKIFKSFSIKKTHYIEKNTVHKLFSILGYREITDKD